MSGHSKWSTIKRKKGAQDSQRAKLWGKLLRFVEVAAREGGGNIEGNPTLATAVQKAKANSVTNDNIERAIKRGTGELQGETYEETSYEGYGPGGVAVLVRCLTSNRNRSAQDVRSAFHSHGGKLAEPGAVAWMFESKGLVVVEAASTSEDDVFLIAADAGAEDVRPSEESIEVITPTDAMKAVRHALEANGVSPDRLLLDKPALTAGGTDAREARRVDVRLR